MNKRSSKIVIRQGDSMTYALPLYMQSTILNDKDIDEVEVSVGTFVRKLYSEGGITFNSDMYYFEVHLTQDDTLKLLPSRGRFGYFEYPTQVRVLLKQNSDYPGYIYSFPGPNVEVLESLSKEKL